MAGIAKPFSLEAALKRSLRAHLRQLGFTKDEAGELVLPHDVRCRAGEKATIRF